MTRKPSPFQSVLIANRGEIACRIIRTAKTMGLRTIAVYSEADADAPHVVAADDARLIGPPLAAQSYLNVEAVLEAARSTGAEAVHPGYGFLSENASFAEACAQAGLVFVGPPPNAIELMGDKAKAKRRMIEAGVPCIPGYQDDDQTDATLARAAAEIGFPIMVKAAAGGGGRGMRLVEAASDFAQAASTARSEAENAFGSGELILEKAILQPRHVEIQVFADRFGNTVHLGERDCSVQRRHQKVLEEAPCPVLDESLRSQMGAAAVKAAKEIGYEGAGTVEFLLDAEKRFFFLEMNTRLQVEHPVTEMVTGADLVEWQFRVAAGEPLPQSQDEIALHGAAIEARLYAEDPAQDFLPATGDIDLWSPADEKIARTDAGIKSGGRISPFYDPMIAKLIAHGATRDEARRKLVTALKNTAFFGAPTNKSFLIWALEHAEFAGGRATTHFIGDHYSEASTPKLSIEHFATAALLMHELSRKKAAASALANPAPLAHWSSATAIETPYRFARGEAEVTLSITPQAGGDFQIASPARTMTARIEALDPHHAVLSIDGERIHALHQTPPDASPNVRLRTSIDGLDLDLENLNAVFSASRQSTGLGAIVAPMHGMLVNLDVAIGDAVAKGQRLAVLEAMKMQHELAADVEGTVTAIHVSAGAQIAADTLLIEIAPDSDD